MLDGIMINFNWKIVNQQIFMFPCLNVVVQHWFEIKVSLHHCLSLNNLLIQDKRRKMFVKIL